MVNILFIEGWAHHGHSSQREYNKQNVIHLVKIHLLLAGRHWWICKFFHSTSGYHQYACNANQRTKWVWMIWQTLLWSNHIYTYSGHLTATSVLQPLYSGPKQNALSIIFLFNEPVYRGHCPVITDRFFWSVGDWMGWTLTENAVTASTFWRHVCKMGKRSFKETLKAHTPY